MPQTKSVAQEEFKSPLPGSAGAVLFSVFVLLSCLVVVALCSRMLGLPEGVRYWVSASYLAGVGCGWLAFTATENSEDFLFGLALFGIACGLVCGMIEAAWPGFFWLTLTAFVLVAVISVAISVWGDSAWDIVVACMFAAWVSAGLIITLGRTPYLPYARPALELAEVSLLLDARLLLTLSVIVVVVGKAMAEAAGAATPHIPLLPPLNVGGEWRTGGLVDAVVAPVVMLANALLLIVQKITNAIWYVVAVVAVYLYRVGTSLADQFATTILNSKVWLPILKVLYSFAAIVCFVVLTEKMSPGVNSYLLGDMSVFALSIAKAGNFLWFAFALAIVLALTVSLCRVWSMKPSPLNKAANCLATILVSWALVGVLVHVLSRFKALRILGFNPPGIYTLVFLLVVGGVLLSQLVKRFAAGQQQAPPRKEVYTAHAALGIVGVGAFLLLAGLAASALPVDDNAFDEIEQNALIERAALEGKEVWYLAKLSNEYGGAVAYAVAKSDGEWEAYSLPPGETIYWWKKGTSVVIKFDANSAPGYQEKVYALVSRAIIDHRPTEQDYPRAMPNYFSAEAGGGVALYVRK